MLNETTRGMALKCLRREHCKSTAREWDSVKPCPARAALEGGGHAWPPLP